MRQCVPSGQVFCQQAALSTPFCPRSIFVKAAKESGNTASGWEAFDDDDLSFLESQMRPENPMQHSKPHHMGTTPPTTRGGSAETGAHSLTVASENTSGFTLTRPTGMRDGSGHLEGERRPHPVSRPAAKAIFSDKDPLIEVSCFYH